VRTVRFTLGVSRILYIQEHFISSKKFGILFLRSLSLFFFGNLNFTMFCVTCIF